MSRRITSRVRPSGFSLLEMAVAISILSVVLALSMTTIVGMFRVERQFARDAQHELALSRLAAQFRADAHRAASAVVASTSGENDCRLVWPEGRSVRYGFTDGRVTREVVRDGATEHRDAFVLARHAAATFEAAPGFRNRLLVLRFGQSGESQFRGGPAVRPFVIEAALGLHGKPPEKEADP